jgi:hypothetical protein
MTRVLEILVRLNLRKMKGNGAPNDMISTFNAAGCVQPEIGLFENCRNQDERLPETRQEGEAGQK